MSILEDIFGAVTGQKSLPQRTIIPTGDLLGQASGLLTSQIAPATLAYNQALAGPLMDIQLGVERQFDPNIGMLRGATTKSILDELNLGSAVPDALQDLVTQRALEMSGASGLGSSTAGDLFGARSLLSAGIDLGRQRRMDALQAVRSSPLPGQLYQPQFPFGQQPGMALAADIRETQAAQDEMANLAEDTRKKNFASVLSTGFRIMGGVAGGFFSGGNPQAIQMGMGAGAGVIQGGGVQGYGQQGGQGNALASIFGGGQGMMGGPQWGIGAQNQWPWQRNQWQNVQPTPWGPQGTPTPYAATSTSGFKPF